MPQRKPTPHNCLRDWVIARTSETGAAWFNGELQRLQAKPSDKDIYLALGYATRKLGKGDLGLSPAELADATAARPGW